MIAETTSLGWHEYGLAGVVIGALFAWIFYQDRGSRQERKDTADSHREERKELQAVNKEIADRSDNRSEKLEVVVTELTNAIRDKGL